MVGKGGWVVTKKDMAKAIAEETGIPYQNLMNHYLADCAAKRLKPALVWQKKGA